MGRIALTSMPVGAYDALLKLSTLSSLHVTFSDYRGVVHECKWDLRRSTVFKLASCCFNSVSQCLSGISAATCRSFRYFVMPPPPT